MANSTMLHVRVDEETKEQATLALAAMGLSVSDAVRILLKRVVNDQAFPLELKVPNAATRQAMDEVQAMIDSAQPGYDTPEAMFHALEEESRRP